MSIRHVLLALPLLVATVFVHAQPVVVQAGKLLDRPGTAPRGAATLLINDGVIIEVRDGHHGPEAFNVAGARVIDLREHFPRRFRRSPDGLRSARPGSLPAHSLDLRAQDRAARICLIMGSPWPSEIMPQSDRQGSFIAAFAQPQQAPRGAVAGDAAGFRDHRPARWPDGARGMQRPLIARGAG